MKATCDLVIRAERVLVGRGEDRRLVAAQLVVNDGRIVEVAHFDSERAARREINAGRDLVVPGFIDLHTHFDNPSDSITESFRLGTANAALGGITLAVDHPFTVPPTTTSAVLRDKIAEASRGALIDFGLWGGLTSEHLRDVPSMMQHGVSGFKAFLPDNDMGVTPASSEHLRRGFELAHGGTILVHAEDREMLRELDERSRREHWDRDYGEFARARGPEIEERAVREVLSIAEETKGSVHFVHLSVPETVDLVTAARERGVRASCEVAAHHLLLTTDDLLERGWAALCAPPLRDRCAVDGMWDRLRAGEISAVVSDHCIYDPVEKAAADQDAFSGPFGIQSIREFAPLFLDEAWTRGWGIEEAIDCLTGRPAQLFGLESLKGAIEVGADADFVILDTDADWEVDAVEQFGDWCWSPYNGRRSRVRVRSTLLRGYLIADSGELASSDLNGRFVAMRGAS